MKLLIQAFALAACAGLLGCSSTPCDEALDKLTGECGLGAGAAIPLSGGGVTECKDVKDSGQKSECASECIIEADCSDITSDETDNSYNECLADCLK